MSEDTEDDGLPPFSHWNYRVMRRAYTHKDATTEYSYGIHEVYYSLDGEPDCHSENDVGIHGETVEELKKDLKNYKRALNKPVLDYKTMKEIK